MNIGKPVSLNLNVRGLGHSATLAINERCAEMQREGRLVYRLGLGQSPFPVPQNVVEALRLHAPAKDYVDVRGLRELRESVAEFHRTRQLVGATAEHVLVGPGSKELLFLLQLVFYGEIIVPSPCWVSYTPQSRIVGRTVRTLPAGFEDRWQMTPDRLLELCEGENDHYRPRLLVLNYPANPHGLTYSRDELAAIAEVARRFQILLLSDEIYGELHHQGHHCSVAQFYPEGTIISSGLSKWCGAGGWRLGTFTFPAELDWLRESMAAVASETYTAVSAPIQHAAVVAFQGGASIERYLAHARRILAALGARCHGILDGAGLRVHPPEGAFYLFADFSPHAELLAARGIRTGRQLCAALLAETGVAILPGNDFERPAGELTARLAYVNFDGAKAMADSESIPLDQPLPDGYLDACCGATLRAMELVAEWVAAGAR
ncbi:MAG: aminotransferase class I/II-fold pyridoxal phosphate-dependent enzyme [Candidatus Eisenbacteria bacterium]|uniref:Aminotransferase n=1 Tax=Eiseniibacteriota bacterium TaxID=2212470 RepID=A0A956LY25_UNCEI|nr:aminotransferase class I/II-fold pyridoxal phosphate-dependent enzyme [Candidatus Eisenbacteria bacterium]